MTASAKPPGVSGLRWRIGLIGLCFLLLLGAAAARLGAMASGDPGKAAVEHEKPAAEPQPLRTEIVDRRGEPLVGNAPTFVIYLDGAALPLEEDRAEAIDRLSEIFADLKDPKVSAPIFKTLAPPKKKLKRRRKSQTAMISRRATPLEAERAHNLGIPGLYRRRRSDRVYFGGRATSHVLGYVSLEGAGQAGLEGALDRELREGGPHPLRLTLDLRVQRRVWGILKRATSTYSARAAAAVVMDARTGEIAAIVSTPDFDPHRRPGPKALKAESSPRFPWATSTGYEPGSTMKLVTWALALEHKAATMDSVIDATKPVPVDGHSISDSRSMGRISFPMAFVRSSNVAAVKLALAVGAKKQRELFRALGLMEPSGVEIAEARSAMPSWHREWRDSSTATTAFGHGMQISPLQLAEMMATLVGGGQRVRATLRAGRVLSPDREQVVSMKTSEHLRTLLRMAVAHDRGTGKKARVKGLDVGGKTGTAEKVENGAYVRDKVVANFISAFPMRSPRYVVVVMLDEPSLRLKSGKITRYAGSTAAPVAGEIIAAVAPLLGVAPEVKTAAE